MVAQDTGGAIKGSVRADFFWGFGRDAADQAGKMEADRQDVGIDAHRVCSRGLYPGCADPVKNSWARKTISHPSVYFADAPSLFSMVAAGIMPGATEPSAKINVGVPLMPFF